MLTLLASQAAVAIENARLYETIRAQRGAHREGAALRAARAGGAAADGTAEAAARRGRRGALRARARARRRSARLPRARAEQRWSSPSATCRARACRRRSTARLPASWSDRGRSAAATRLSASAPAAVLASMNTHPPRAPARGVLLHALLRVLRFQAARRDDGELGTAVSDPLPAATAARRSSCQACRSVRLPASTYDEVVVRAAAPAMCSCSARTASSRRRHRADASSARSGCSTSSRAHRTDTARRSSTRSSRR